MVKFKVGDSNRNSVEVMGRHFTGGTIYDSEWDGIPLDEIKKNKFQIVGESPAKPKVKAPEPKVKGKK